MKYKIKIKFERKHFDKEYDGTTYSDIFGTFPNYTYSYYDVTILLKVILSTFEEQYSDYSIDVNKLKVLDSISDIHSIEFITDMPKKIFIKLIIAIISTSNSLRKGFAILEIK